MPRLLSAIRAPPLRSVGQTLPLGQVNLWMGGGGGGGAAGPHDAPLLTDLHKDSRPNLLAVLRGSKRVVTFPPSDERRLRPAVLLDVQSTAASRGAGGGATGGEQQPSEDLPSLLPGSPRLPASAEDALLDRQHFLLSAAEAAELLRPAPVSTSLASSSTSAADAPLPGACSFEVEAPDALFLPPGWAHAVETRGAPPADPSAAAAEVAAGGQAVAAATGKRRDGDFGAAVNVFYELPAQLMCGALVALGGTFRGS